MTTNRRTWLKQSAITLAALSLKNRLFASENNIAEAPPGMIWLSRNENAYGPSPMARKAITEHYLKSNRYPDDHIQLLKKKIADHWNVSEENILLGAGSSDIIGLACHHVSQPKGNIVMAEPSYQVWNGQAAAFGLSFNRISLNQNKKMDLPSMVGSINANTRMIYFCNPNNPTGTVTDMNELKDHALAAAKKTFVFIDEAYTEYANLSTLAPIAIKNKSIVVAKTFSKVYGLAGARVCYAIVHADTIKTLAAYQPWRDAGVSMVSSVAAFASLDDKEFVSQCRENTSIARESCYATFKELSLDHIPSSTNFILFNIDKIKKDLTKEMAGRNIYVQHREHFGGKWCRVSMGTIEEMQQFCKALKEIAA
jgi:histidinol-phosphate aminotransferase